MYLLFENYNEYGEIRTLKFFQEKYRLVSY